VETIPEIRLMTRFMPTGAHAAGELASKIAAEGISHRYHKPSDEFDPNWDLSGAMEDLELYFDVGLMLAMERGFPNWRPGNEFRAIREQSRAGGAASQ